jgi:hypothetical protein
MMQTRGLVVHSNTGSCAMNSSGELDTIKQLWLNNGGITTIILLQQIELICPVSFNSGSIRGSFVIHSDQPISLFATTTKVYPSSISGISKLKWLLASTRMLSETSSKQWTMQMLRLFRPCTAKWKASPNARSRALVLPTKPRQYLATQQIANFWGWYVTT